MFDSSSAFVHFGKSAELYKGRAYTDTKTSRKPNCTNRGASEHARRKPGSACQECRRRKVKCPGGYVEGRPCSTCVKNGCQCLPQTRESRSRVKKERQAKILERAKVAEANNVPKDHWNTELRAIGAHETYPERAAAARSWPEHSLPVAVPSIPMALPEIKPTPQCVNENMFMLSCPSALGVNAIDDREVDHLDRAENELEEATRAFGEVRQRYIRAQSDYIAADERYHSFQRWRIQCIRTHRIETHGISVAAMDATGSKYFQMKCKAALERELAIQHSNQAWARYNRARAIYNAAEERYLRSYDASSKRAVNPEDFASMRPPTKRRRMIR